MKTSIISRAAIVALSWMLLTIQVHAAELIMVEEPGCPWCARWNAEIGPIYPKTAESKVAPLRRIDISVREPGDFTYARRVVFTPTFVLVDQGQELARIEGYPGEDFFWALLAQMLKENKLIVGGS